MSANRDRFTALTSLALAIQGAPVLDHMFFSRLPPLARQLRTPVPMRAIPLVAHARTPARTAVTPGGASESPHGKRIHPHPGARTRCRAVGHGRPLQYLGSVASTGQAQRHARFRQGGNEAVADD